jgi:hypothetical protein
LRFTSQGTSQARHSVVFSSLSSPLYLSLSICTRNLTLELRSQELQRILDLKGVKKADVVAEILEQFAKRKAALTPSKQ